MGKVEKRLDSWVWGVSVMLACLAKMNAIIKGHGFHIYNRYESTASTFSLLVGS